MITPSLEDFQQARLFLQNYQTRLRTGDALHLAMAFRERASHIYNLDRGMVDAGSILGMAISFGNINI